MFRENRRGNWPGGGRGRGRGRGVHRSGFNRNAPKSPSIGRGCHQGASNQISSKRPFIVGYHKLKKWSEMENEELATDLYGNQKPFGEVLSRKRLSDDFMNLILQIFHKLSQASALAMKRHIVEESLRHKIFWQATLPQYLRKQQLCTIDSQKLRTMILNLTKTVIEIMKLFTIKILPLESILACAKAAGGLQNEMKKLQTLIEKSRQSNRARAFTTHDAPPNDIRDQPSYPTMQEVKANERPYLRPIKAEGCYDDLSHYLDVQFRLLKEDLVYPLREGIRERLSGSLLREKKHDLQVYSEVELVSINCTMAGLTFTVHFVHQSKRPVFWKHTKRLIFGSLLCFSTDGFQTMVFATVANRDARDLEKGLLDVRFLDGIMAYNYFRRIKNAPCEMAECPSYFEAYKHVLDGLKEIEEIAMDEFIVEGSKENSLPVYLKQNQHCVYNLSNVAEKEDTMNVRICRQKSWPRPEKLIFNPSQFEAFRHALTNKFAVLQGPPGTGKTFVALKIVDTLLRNKSYWQRVRPTPMLIVCYTNHALDQFLNGLIDHGHTNILRLGGRASEDLDAYTLKAAKEKQTRDKAKSETGSIRRAKYESHKKREAIEEQLEPYLLSLQQHHKKFVNGKLLEFQNLRPFINAQQKAHLSRFESACANSQFSLFDIFLEVYNFEKEDIFNLAHQQQQNIQDGGEDVSFEQQFEQLSMYENPNDLLNIEGEGEVLADRWAVDQNEFSKTKKKNRQTTPMSKYGQPKPPMRQLTTKDGFVFVLPKKSERKKRIRANMKKYSAMSRLEAEAVTDPWSLKIDQRWRLYQYWLSLYTDEYFNQVSEGAEDFEDACSSLKELKEQEDEQIMKTVDVIAMTTTCAARYRRILKNIGPKIVVIEEAAEVLEAHVITSLTPSTEHLILIGDHKQLRPNPSVFELAKKFNLELSLFERMVNNGMQCQTLNVQHRMRPEISRLIKHIYPMLRDHSKVMTYPHVKGVEKDVVFVSHNHEENSNSQKSKVNKYEAEYIVALCRYLLLQGYEPSQITVLTGYSGQLTELKRLMPRTDFEGVRVTTVDNFQGEENDVILLSLVRSNTSGSIGFLGTDNRVNVALSRAKHGMFVIGNFELLEEKSRLWRNIVGDCRRYEYLSHELQLYCQNHPKTKISVRQPIDFDKAPDGGCQLDCKQIMRCGHLCWKKCHPADPEHLEIKCRVACPKKCKAFGHRCRELCHYGEECKPCQYYVDKALPCGHVTKIECCRHEMDPNEIRCLDPCKKTRSCGHTCKGQCYENCAQVPCKVEVERELPCGHKAMVDCSADLETRRCYTKVEKVLPCGHTDTQFCCLDIKAIRCKTKVTKWLKCGHEALVDCSTDATLAKCQTKVLKLLSCGHSMKAPCDTPRSSIKCIEMTSMKLPCDHKVSVECSTDVKKVKCTEKVFKKLPCKEHQKYMECHESVQNVKCDKQALKTGKCGHKMWVKCSQLVSEVKCEAQVLLQYMCNCHIKTRCFARKTTKHYCTKPVLKKQAEKLIQKIEHKVLLTVADTTKRKELTDLKIEIKRLAEQLDDCTDISPTQAKLNEVEKKLTGSTMSAKSLARSFSKLEI